MLRIMFLGQKPIGELCFEQLLNGQNDCYAIAAAVTNSDRDNVWWHSNQIYENCMKKNIPFIDSSKRNEAVLKEVIIDKKINFIVSVGYGWILSSEILKLVEYKAVNLHLAKLPDYKGNYTYNHAILNDEKTYGVTFHWMADKVDMGDYIFTSEFPIDFNDTAYSLYLKSVKEGLDLFKKFIGFIAKDMELPRRKMEGNGRFYSRSSLDGLKELQSYDDLENIARKSRAFYFPPFDNAYFVINGKKYFVYPEENDSISK